MEQTRRVAEVEGAARRCDAPLLLGQFSGCESDSFSDHLFPLGAPSVDNDFVERFSTEGPKDGGRGSTGLDGASVMMHW